MHNGNASHTRWPISAVWSTVPAWERRLRGWLTTSRCKDGSPWLLQGPEEALFSVRTSGCCSETPRISGPHSGHDQLLSLWRLPVPALLCPHSLGGKGELSVVTALWNWP